MLWLLAVAHALPVALPPSADPSLWRGPAALAGVELEPAAAGARATIRGDAQWEVWVVDAHGREHRFTIARPADEDDREDLLATIRSLAEPVEATPLPTLSLGVPEAPAPPTAPPAPRKTPPTPRKAVPNPQPTPQTPPPEQLAPPEPPQPAVVPPPPDPPQPDPVIVPLDEAPPERSPGLRLRLSTGVGLQLREEVRAGLRLGVGAAVEHRRLAVTWWTTWVPTQRTKALGPLRWWSEIGSTIGLERVGRGPGGGIAVGALVRRFAEIRGEVGWTATPMLRASLGWGVPWKRWAVHPMLWGQAEAGRVELKIDGESVGRLSRFAGGITLRVDRIAIGR